MEQYTERKAVGKPRLQYLKQVAKKKQELTVIQRYKELFATIPNGKLPTNQKIAG